MRTSLAPHEDAARRRRLAPRRDLHRIGGKGGAIAVAGQRVERRRHLLALRGDDRRQPIFVGEAQPARRFIGQRLPRRLFNLVIIGEVRLGVEIAGRADVDRPAVLLVRIGRFAGAVDIGAAAHRDGRGARVGDRLLRGDQIVAVDAVFDAKTLPGAIVPAQRHRRRRGQLGPARGPHGRRSRHRDALRRPDGAREIGRFRPAGREQADGGEFFLIVWRYRVSVMSSMRAPTRLIDPASFGVSIGMRCPSASTVSTGRSTVVSGDAGAGAAGWPGRAGSALPGAGAVAASVPATVLVTSGLAGVGRNRAATKFQPSNMAADSSNAVIQLRLSSTLVGLSSCLIGDYGTGS